MWNKPQEPLRMTHEEWEAYLCKPGQKLTLDELMALELVHSHASLERVTAGLGVHPHINGGYLEQIRNVIDGVLKRVSRVKPPTVEHKELSGKGVS